jgi:hypothetical protein
MLADRRGSRGRESPRAEAEAIPRGPGIRRGQPNKRKQTKTKASKIAFISIVYFLESGLFNGLRPIKTRKSFPVSSPARHGSRPYFRLLLWRPSVADDRGSIRRVFDDIARISAFLKKLHTRFSPAAASRVPISPRSTAVGRWRSPWSGSRWTNFLSSLRLRPSPLGHCQTRMLDVD